RIAERALVPDRAVGVVGEKAAQKVAHSRRLRERLAIVAILDMAAVHHVANAAGQAQLVAQAIRDLCESRIGTVANIGSSHIKSARRWRREHGQGRIAGDLAVIDDEIVKARNILKLVIKGISEHLQLFGELLGPYGIGQYF